MNAESESLRNEYGNLLILLDSFDDQKKSVPRFLTKAGTFADTEITKDSRYILEWLNEIGMLKKEETNIQISVGGHELNGIIYDTPLAKEIMEMMPLTVSMVGYGGREYYGSMPSVPKNSGEGQLNFENGDITYCPTNNTLAIFYAQTSRPNLTMEVIPIGKVTSDLSVFDTLGSRENITFSIEKETDATSSASINVEN
ncbi:MAG: hypothetical protein J6B01_06275 [Ruminococcus sp.]|nr:hypothetical protein [Ruminococcus sp.]